MTQKQLADVPPDWYDFGGGIHYTMANNYDAKGALEGPPKWMAAICCVVKGQYYYKTYEFDTENPDIEKVLQDMKAELMPTFIEELQRLTQEKTI